MASSDDTARIWDARTGKELKRFQGSADLVSTACFSPTSAALVIGSGSFGQYPDQEKSSVFAANVWDLTSGTQRTRLLGHTALPTAEFSPDGGWIVTAGQDQALRLWDAETGQAIWRLTDSRATLSCGAFSPDQMRLLVPRAWGVLAAVDARTGATVRVYSIHAGEVAAENVEYATYSSDSRTILAACGDGVARLIDAETGAELRKFGGPRPGWMTAELSPEGSYVLTAPEHDAAQLWDTASGKPVRSFGGGGGPAIRSAVFSPDGTKILAVDWDHQSLLYDLGGRLLHTFHGPAAALGSACFSRDGRFVLTGMREGETRIWDTRTGKELCRIISFRDGTWAVIDPEGRFDTSNGGDVEGLHWVVGMEPIALSQLKDRYYEPHLLAKIMGFNKEPLRKVPSFADADVKLYPEIVPKMDAGTLRVGLTNRGGGIGKVEVLVNGKEVAADARGPKPNPNAPSLKLALDLSHNLNLVAGRPNTVEVRAYNAEGYLRSRGVTVVYTPKAAAPAALPELWAVVAGISDYAGEGLRLKFAAKDAEDFAAALRIAGGRLFPKVLLTALTTGGERPTKANLVRRFKDLAKAKPQDVLVVYLAGHGVNFGGQDGDFYYLTAEALSGELKDRVVAKETALSSREITDLILKCPAHKQVVILDTCASGGLLTDADRAKIPVRQVCPVFLKPSFVLHTEPFDTLGLTKALEDQLSDAEARGPQAKLVFWSDVSDFARGYALRGWYDFEGDTVSVSCWMQFGDKKWGPFTVKGTKPDIAGLAKAILADAERRVGGQP